jgi:dephospho-CoA kinase
MIKSYNPDYPIIVGLAGKAATGKTSVAETIVPKASFSNEREGMVWDHIFFAMPIYEFYSIRTKIEGLNAESRKLFATQETLYDIYGGSPIAGVPEYNTFIELNKRIANEPLLDNGSKPRSYLQKIGDYCREHDEECFAKWGIRKANKIHREYLRGLEEDQITPHCILISDVRFVNEAEAILKSPNSMIITFDASDEVRKERIMSRDGFMMTDEQMAHKSEQQIDLIRDLSTAIIDSSSMNVEGQSIETINRIKERFNTNA